MTLLTVTGFGPGTQGGGMADDRGRPMALNRVLAQAERQVTRRLDPLLAGEGLTVDQWRVLDLLADGEGHPMSAIAAAIVVPGPSLTKIVDRLVDTANVYRLVDDRDRRRVLAFISDRGREVHHRLAPRLADVEAEALSALDADASTLVRLLGRLVEPRHQAMPSQPPGR